MSQAAPIRWLAAGAARIVLVVAFAGASMAAQAQDFVNGKALYKIWCQSCHTVDPGSAIEPFNQIMTAAGNPALIAAAALVDPTQMGFISTALSEADRADIAAYLATFVATKPAVAVVEFYSEARDHYFMSTSAAEIADLDNGVHAGWVRTGASFKAFVLPTGVAGPVCRFYLPPASGDSHFYSASPVECAEVGASFPAFVLEAPDVFHLELPDPVTGVCSLGTTPVYRVWNARADTNHRYTTSMELRQQMQAAGWIAEGYGPSQVIMCAPS